MTAAAYVPRSSPASYYATHCVTAVTPRVLLRGEVAIREGATIIDSRIWTYLPG
jgi:hypothetical protein